MKEITIGQRFEMGKQVAEKLDGMDGDTVQLAINSADHSFWSDLVKHFGRKVKSVLRFLKSVTVNVTSAKETAGCFTDKARYYYRDDILGANLPKVQPVQSESIFGVLELTEVATFKEIAENILEVSGDINILSQLLKKRGHTTILPAIEALIERQESGEDVGLLTKDWANFFFVENEDESVSVVYLLWNGRQWDVGWDPLSCDFRWRGARRLFARNFLGTP